MLTILQGDALEKLRELPDESVQCCVTSPPFWGLRDYGTAKWEGGIGDCEHKPSQEWLDRNFNASRGERIYKGNQNAGERRWFEKDGSCKCGARRIDSQLGLEKTPDDYVAKLVAVFREVRRILRNDGTLWLNLGDSYASSWPCSRRNQIGNGSLANGKREARPPRMADGLKEKDLVGIPWMVAFALRADGWWLRSDIIWAKPNPMPESVTDRPTKAHEYIFLLTKSARYFYDAAAIAEPVTWSDPRLSNPNWWPQRKERDYVGAPSRGGGPLNKRNGYLRVHGNLPGRDDGGAACNDPNQDSRNKRSVWTVTTQPYPDAHFATYPPDLIKPCILSGSKVGDDILDPFAGSGTTGQVALELGRRAILIELNPKYVALIEQRTNITPGLALA